MKKHAGIAKRIKRLRKDRVQNQAEFAKSVGATQPMVSAWEKGDAIPSAGAFLRLGSLAGYPDTTWFWQQAGMEEEALLSAAEKLLKERGTTPGVGETVRVPCEVMVRRDEEVAMEQTGKSVILPGDPNLVANPGSTFCLVVKEDTRIDAGISFGDLVVLDTSDNQAKDLRPFWNQTVLIDAGTSGGLFTGLLLLQLTNRGDAPNLRWTAIVGNSVVGSWNGPRPPTSKPPTGNMAVTTTFFQTRSQHGASRRALIDVTGMAEGADNIIPHGLPASPTTREENPENAKALDQARSEISLDPPYRIVGRVIGWFRPLAPKAV